MLSTAEIDFQMSPGLFKVLYLWNNQVVCTNGDQCIIHLILSKHAYLIKHMFSILSTYGLSFGLQMEDKAIIFTNRIIKIIFQSYEWCKADICGVKDKDKDTRFTTSFRQACSVDCTHLFASMVQRDRPDNLIWSMCGQGQAPNPTPH